MGSRRRRKKPLPPPRPLPLSPRSGTSRTTISPSSKTGLSPTSALCRLPPPPCRSRLRFQLLPWLSTNGALRRLKIGPARLPRALPRLNGEAASLKPGAERRFFFTIHAAFIRHLGGVLHSF